MATDQAKNRDPKSLADAIERLEELAAKSKTGELRDVLEKDLREIREALGQVKPLLDQMKSKVVAEAREASHQVDAKVKENPWVAIGIAGLLSFVLGLFLGKDRRQ